MYVCSCIAHIASKLVSLNNAPTSLTRTLFSLNSIFVSLLLAQLELAFWMG